MRKALSIQQPWAWLIVNGLKDIENRDWPTKYRGSLLVHAGKKIDTAAIAFLRDEFPDVVLPATYESGGIVGECMLTGCVQQSESRWFFGAYGFTLSHASPLPFRAVRGQLGLFEVADA